MSIPEVLLYVGVAGIFIGLILGAFHDRANHDDEWAFVDGACCGIFCSGILVVILSIVIYVVGHLQWT
jgi:F0F1-type ATP synthase assembly protein I